MTIPTWLLATFLSAQLVSLDTAEMELSAFIRSVAKTANMNVVLHPAVQGKVNLVVKDVAWEEILDLVLKNHGFVKEIEGNTIRIAPEGTLPLHTYVYYLKYARAEVLAPIIATLLQQEEAESSVNTTKLTIRYILRDTNILVLALVSCFFEGSLFLFIFFIAAQARMLGAGARIQTFMSL